MSNNKKLAYEETLDCVQCGYCLPACPTYLTMKKETHSPRGRINLVKLAAENKISLNDIEEPINLCLGCRACEVVCPTNVQYGKILESAKEVLHEKNKQEKPKSTMFQNFVFSKVLPSDTTLNVMGAGLSFYGKSGMQTIAHKTKLLNVLPENLRSFEGILPDVEGPIQKRKRFENKKENSNKPIYHIGFFKGCIMDTMFSSINTQSVRLLEAAGCKVTVIKDQTCCGALQSHSGELDVSKQLAKRNIEAFEKYDLDYIVNSIGGCGAMLVEYDKLLANEPEWKERAKKFSDINVDISVILHELTLPFQKEINKVVTYQPSCHMSNVQKRINEPLSFLQVIPGIEYIELPHKNMCCGSAGIYNIVNFDDSMDILDEKMENVRKVERKPDIIVTTNPGCHLQMKLGIERDDRLQDLQVVHLVELLAEACDL